jgi:hypothetical protein
LPRLKIRWKSDGDNRGWYVTWSDIENQGLVLFLCALDVEDHFKGDSGASRFRFASGDGGDPKHVPQATFSVFMGVLPRDRLNCAHESGRCGHGEAETGFQGGRRNVDKHATLDCLRAGVAGDDLSEKALGTV